MLPSVLLSFLSARVEACYAAGPRFSLSHDDSERQKSNGDPAMEPAPDLLFRDRESVTKRALEIDKVGRYMSQAWQIENSRTSDPL